MSRRRGRLPRPALPAAWVVAAALACGGGPKPESEPAPAAWPTPRGPLPDTAELTRIQPARDTGAVAAADTAAPAPTPPAAEPAPAPPPQEFAGPVEPGVVAPNMTEAQVRAALGAPLYVRTYGEHTYYFYDNGREREAGFLDFVTFRNGRVVDAVFRAPDRRYVGNSSSPPGVTPRPTAGAAPLAVPPAAPPGPAPKPDTAAPTGPPPAAPGPPAPRDTVPTGPADTLPRPVPPAPVPPPAGP